MNRVLSLLVLLGLGISACGGDSGRDECVPTDPGCGDGSTTIDGTYALQSVNELALPATIVTTDEVELVFSDGTLILGQGRTWDLTINATQDGQAGEIHRNNQYDLTGTTLTFHCSETETFQGTIQSGVLQIAFDADCDGAVDVDLRFGHAPPPTNNPVVGTYTLYSMGLCELGGDPCAPSSVESRLPVNIGTATYHAGSITIYANGIWEMALESTTLGAPTRNVYGGEYTTSGTNITFVQSRCRDLPYSGTVQGGELKFLFDLGCDIRFDLILTFRK